MHGEVDRLNSSLYMPRTFGPHLEQHDLGRWRCAGSRINIRQPHTEHGMAEALPHTTPRPSQWEGGTSVVCFRIRTPHPGPDPPHRRPKRLNRAGYGAEPLSACSAGPIEFERSREAARHDISLVHNGVISSGLTCPDSPKTVLTAPAELKTRHLFRVVQAKGKDRKTTRIYLTCPAATTHDLPCERRLSQTPGEFF